MIVAYILTKWIESQMEDFIAVLCPAGCQLVIVAYILTKWIECQMEDFIAVLCPADEASSNS